MDKELQEIADSIRQLKSEIREVREGIKSGKMKKQILQEISKAVFKDYKKIFNKSINLYYSSYEPEFYDRTYSLYEMYDFKVDDDDIYTETGPEFAQSHYLHVSDPTTQHRIGSDYIYEKMFVEGWHGGATPSNKLDIAKRPYPPGYKMAYRTPVGNVYRNGDSGPYLHLKRFSLWSMRRVARMSGSPQQIIDNQLDKYEAGQNNFSGHGMDERVDEGMANALGQYELFNI